MLGKATIPVVSTSESTSSSKENTALIKATNTTNRSESYSEKDRDLLSADEVRRLNRESMLMFVQGIPPILAERISYFKDPMFTSRFDRNPYV
jgi:type IV secretory pathway TraG/TraD family ATPase VirD4